MDEVEAIPHLQAGEEHLQREEWAEAERAFRQAVTLHDASAVGWSKLGVALARQGRYDDAVAALRRALDLNPGYAPAHSNLGNVYREQGRRDEALAAYRRAVEADPDYWVARQNLGALYREMGRVGEAVAEFKAATRLSLRGGSRRGCLGTGVLLLAVLVALAALVSVAVGSLRP